MKKLFFTYLFALTACFVEAQHNQYPSLSQQQMYQNYDTLVSTLLQVSPQPPFRKKLTGFDITRFYEQNRSKIKDIKTLQEFYSLIRSTSTANQDAHTGLMRAELMPADMMKNQGISDSAISCIPAYAVWYTAPATANHLNLQLSYVNGRYFNMRSFSYKNKIYKRGIELTGCNGKPIKTYINELYPFLNMKWDVIHHCYFSESFFKSFNLSSGDTLNLKFEGIPNDAAFGVADSVNFIGDGPVIDYTDVEEASDILHDRVKIPVSLDFQTLVELMNDEDRYSTTFLVVKDPYFKYMRR